MSKLEPPPMLPLRRISPSRFHASQQCALREVWKSGGASPLLPKGPGAWLGQVIHSLLERAGKHEIANAEDIHSHWQSLLAEVEQEMCASLLTKHFAPLLKTAPHFEIRMRQAQKLAAAMLSARPTQPTAKASSERWFQTADGTVGGKVDRVVAGPDGVTISDFKSGAITESETDSEVKLEYKVQLMLYAALYKATTGDSPCRLQVVGLDGHPREIPFTMDECETILRAAQMELIRINSLVSSSAGAEQKQTDLASPSSITCRYCEFRPACGPYSRSRPAPPLESDDTWPVDIYGTLKDVRMLGNGRLWLRVSDSGDRTWVVRGLDAVRHEALRERPHRIGVFSLSKDTVPNSFVESPMTTVYPL